LTQVSGWRRAGAPRHPHAAAAWGDPPPGAEPWAVRHGRTQALLARAQSGVLCAHLDLPQPLFDDVRRVAATPSQEPQRRTL